MQMVVRNYDLHPIVRFVRSLDGEFYLRREAARQLGRAPTTLRAVHTAHPELDLGPTHLVAYGQLQLELYTPERIEELRQYFTRERPPRACDGLPRERAGRPRLWSADEAHERARAQDRARKRIALAKRQKAAGMYELAADSFAKAQAVMDELAAQYEKRFAEVTSPRIHGLE